MIKLKQFYLLCYALLCYATVFSLPVTATEYYTWIDENGVTNYSEKVPVGYQGTKVTKTDSFGYKPSSQTEGQGTDETSDDGTEDENADDAEVDAQISEETKRVEQEIAEVKRSNCEIGKRNLAQLMAYSRIRIKGEDGKERMLAEEEKQTKIAEARKIIRENCMG